MLIPPNKLLKRSIKQKEDLLSQTHTIHFSWRQNQWSGSRYRPLVCLCELKENADAKLFGVGWLWQMGQCSKMIPLPLFYFMRYDHQGLWLVTTSDVSDCPQPIVKDQGKISSLGTMCNNSRSMESLICSVLKNAFSSKLTCPTAGREMSLSFFLYI